MNEQENKNQNLPENQTVQPVNTPEARPEEIKIEPPAAAAKDSVPKKTESRRRQAQAETKKAAAKKKNKRFGPASIAILVVCALVFVGAVAMVIRGITEEQRQRKEIEELKRLEQQYDMTPGSEDEANEVEKQGSDDGKNAPISQVSLDDVSYLKVNNFQQFKDINSDMVAWMYLPGPESIAGLPIDMSVVQTTDNAYYLDHTFRKDSNINGWLFADYENDMRNFGSSYNSVFYGHARSDNMFGGLKYLNEHKDWYENGYNHFIKITTETEETVWQIFSWYETTVDFYYIQVNFDTPDEFVDFATLLQSKNTIKNADGSSAFGTFEFTPDSRIITLSTCKGLDKNVRVAMHAVLVKSQPRTQN